MCWFSILYYVLSWVIMWESKAFFFSKVPPKISLKIYRLKIEILNIYICWNFLHSTKFQDWSCEVFSAELRYVST